MNKRTLLISAAVIAAGAAGYGWYKNKSSSPAQPQGGMKRRRRATAVQTEPVQVTTVFTTLSALGTVVPNQTANVVSQISGRLLEILFKEGDYVKKGTLLAKVDTSNYEANLSQYQGVLAENQAKLANARAILARYQRLLAQDSISRQDVETQTALVKQYEGSIRSTEGQIASVRVSLGYGRIIAPISGFIGIRNKDIGNLVGPSDQTPIAVITETRPAAVEFTIPQTELSSVVSQIRKGSQLPVEIYDQSGAALIATGSVKTIGNEVDTATGTVKLKATFPNTDDRLFPNMFVNVKLVTGSLPSAVVVPTAAVQNGTSGDFVFTVDEQSVAHKVPVKLGPVSGDNTVILSGLSGGERVITVGVDSASDGGEVKVVQPQTASQAAVGETQPAAEGEMKTGAGKSKKKQQTDGAAGVPESKTSERTNDKA